MRGKKIKILVVDDSAFMRKFIGDIISRDNELELVGTARDGEDALKKKDLLKPDVLTLDLEMPRLDGLATLRRLMETELLPVIMVSSHTRKGSEITLEALSAGAVDFVTKPSLFKGESAEELKIMLPQKIKAAAGARLYPRAGMPVKSEEDKTKKVFSEKLSKPFRHSALDRSLCNVVAIGASTGGPRALEDVIRGFPADLPAAVLITQHMPPGFTESFAKRLDRVSGLKVREARGKEKILPGEAYVAPGGYHLIVEAGQTVLSSTPPVQHVRPSADVMMESVAQFFGPGAIGVILTGMGRDGADGMAHIKKNGGRTIAQDPSTAVIASMPQAVIKNGLADEIVPLDRIAAGVSRLLNNKNGKEG